MKMKKRLVFSAIYYAILCILFVREKRGWFLVIRNAIKFQSGEIEREREKYIYYSNRRNISKYQKLVVEKKKPNPLRLNITRIFYFF